MPKQAEYLKPINHIGKLRQVKKLLLIYSDSDAYTPLAMGERFRNKANTDVALWNASGSDHTLAYKVYGDDYWNKFVDFF